MNTKKAARLVVNSFHTIDPQAEHWYASVNFHDGHAARRYHAERPMTAEEAERLNGKDGVDLYEAGTPTIRFPSEYAALKAGIQRFREECEPLGLDYLFLDNIDVDDPVQVLVGEKQAVVDELNAIWKAFEENNGYDDDVARGDMLYHKYHEILSREGIER